MLLVDHGAVQRLGQRDLALIRRQFAGEASQPGADLQDDILRTEFRLLGDELPYATTVEIEKFEVEGALRRIYAAIVVDRDSHKAIVIGKAGRHIAEANALDHIAAITDITSSAAAVDETEDEEWLIREPGVLLTDESHHAIAEASTMAVHEHEPALVAAGTLIDARLVGMQAASSRCSRSTSNAIGTSARTAAVI